MIDAKFSAIRSSRPHEWLIRFAFGGAATVLAGVVAQHWGAGIGGLFLAFPAICPATLTLLESREKERMAQAGHDGSKRGQLAAAVDAAGTALGCVGLMAFALVLHALLPSHSGWMAIPAAAVAWAVVACACWLLRRKRIFHRRGHRRGQSATRQQAGPGELLHR